ncbi:MAG: twin transmembrane helix small protein [Gammaproteobacteria bacterium]
MPDVIVSGATMLSKILIVLIFLGIVASMGSALFFLVKDKGQSTRILHALTIRIGVSIALFALLFVLWGLGLITPHGVRP